MKKQYESIFKANKFASDANIQVEAVYLSSEAAWKEIIVYKYCLSREGTV